MAGGFESFRSAYVVAIQPNVPMSGLDYQKWQQLRQHQIDLAEARDQKRSTELKPTRQPPITIILPESPMNFAYDDDPEFHKFINDFATRNNVSVLFNSTEPDKSNGKYFNSAVMVGPDGKVAAEYDKIYLLPFGEAVPSRSRGLCRRLSAAFRMAASTISCRSATPRRA